MDESNDDIEVAIAAARDLVALCDRLGNRLAGCHVQLGLDRLEGSSNANSVREIPEPWGESN